jgi:hypothetical protein
MLQFRVFVFRLPAHDPSPPTPLPADGERGVNYSSAD